VIAAGAAFGVELLQRFGQPCERLVVIEGALNEPASFGQPVPDHLTKWRAGVIFYELVDLIAEVLVSPIPAAEADQREGRR
jgi:hypothetical protein